MKTVYRLRNNKTFIADVQEASLHRKDLGLRITHGLFGSEEWWNKIKSGELPVVTVTGAITRVFMSGMNDYPEFEVIEREGVLSRWTRDVDESQLDKYYRPDARVAIDYVIQRFKRGVGMGLDSKCVIEIRVDELDDSC